MTSRYPVEAPPAARRLWCELAGAPGALAPSTRTVVRGSQGICPSGWIGVVRLGSAFLVEAGDADETVVARILDLDDPSDPQQVSGTVGPSQTRGPGQLAYLPEGVPPPSVDSDADLELVDVAGIRDWLRALPEDDVAESSVDNMEHALVLRRDGRVVGAAGHLNWPADIAHIGIIVDPAYRGSGNGVLLGTAATQRAITAGRYPQWRAAAWNETSRATGKRIGYHEFGRQFSFSVK